MLRHRSVCVVAAACGLCLAGTAHAQHDHGEHFHGEHHGEFHGPPPHFGPQEMDRWRGGEWRHAEHNGHLGWWWFSGGQWYAYPQPVYPYPSPYAPPVIAAPQPDMWYYCANPPGYYPYVQQCAVPWQAVPPSAPG